MILSHVVAMSKNRVIGNNNSIPWNIPEDRKYFRNLTLNHSIIMGRKTFNSLNNKPLPKRHNVVVSRTLHSFSSVDGIPFCESIKKAISICKEKSPEEKEAFIIGGAEIYKESMPLISKIYLTLIHHNFEGDTFYPEIPQEFKEISRIDKFDSYYYSFIIYENSNFSIEF